MSVQLSADGDFEHVRESASTVVAIAKVDVRLSMRNAKTNNVPTLLKSLIGLLGSNPMNHLLEELGMKKDFDFLTNPLVSSYLFKNRFNSELKCGKNCIMMYLLF